MAVLRRRRRCDAVFVRQSDLFNYDFRRTEMCIIPYGPQQDEIRQHMEMERLYRQQVLEEQPTIRIQRLRTACKQEVQGVAHKPQV